MLLQLLFPPPTHADAELTSSDEAPESLYTSDADAAFAKRGGLRPRNQAERLLGFSHAAGLRSRLEAPPRLEGFRTGEADADAEGSAPTSVFNDSDMDAEAAAELGGVGECLLLLECARACVRCAQHC